MACLPSQSELPKTRSGQATSCTSPSILSQNCRASFVLRYPSRGSHDSHAPPCLNVLTNDLFSSKVANPPAPSIKIFQTRISGYNRARGNTGIELPDRSSKVPWTHAAHTQKLKITAKEARMPEAGYPRTYTCCGTTSCVAAPARPRPRRRWPHLSGKPASAASPTLGSRAVFAGEWVRMPGQEPGRVPIAVLPNGLQLGLEFLDQLGRRNRAC